MTENITHPEVPTREAVAVRVIVRRVLTLRQRWVTLTETPSAKKTDIREAKEHFNGACMLAAEAVNILGDGDYTPFGMQLRLSDLATEEKLGFITWRSTEAEREEYGEREDRVVARFTEEILSA